MNQRRTKKAINGWASAMEAMSEKAFKSAAALSRLYDCLEEMRERLGQVQSSVQRIEDRMPRDGSYRGS